MEVGFRAAGSWIQTQVCKIWRVYGLGFAPWGWVHVRSDHSTSSGCPTCKHIKSQRTLEPAEKPQFGPAASGTCTTRRKSICNPESRGPRARKPKCDIGTPRQLKPPKHPSPRWVEPTPSIRLQVGLGVASRV